MRRTFFLFLLLAVFAMGSQAACLEGTVFEKVGKRKNIDPTLLYAYALAESGFSPEATDYVMPWPWTLRMPREAFYGKTKADAAARLIQEMRRTNLVDIGMMQINLKWHGRKVKNPVELLNPETNVSVAADIILSNMRRWPDDAFKAIGAYHSYEPERARSYAKMVWRIYSRLKAEDSCENPTGRSKGHHP